MKPSKDLDEQIDEILQNHFRGYAARFFPEDQDNASEIFDSSVEKAKQQLLAIIEQREREARVDGRRIQAEATFDKWHSVEKLEGFGTFAEGQKLAWQYEALQKGARDE